jgi:hypothetical protein
LNFPNKSISVNRPQHNEVHDTFGDDQCLEFALFRSTLHDFGLDRMGTHEPENEHRLGLANPMGSVLGLDVHLRVL